MIWVSALIALVVIIGGSVYVYQQKQVQVKTVEEQQKETLAAKQASVQAEKELESSKRAQIVPMPSEATKPQDNIELGWTTANATKFVTKVSEANKNRPDFPKLQIEESDALKKMSQLKRFFTKPYFALILEPNEKPRQLFLKNNGNHTVTIVLTEGTTAIPVHQYTIDSSTYQVLNDKEVDAQTSITTWNGF